MRSVTRRKCVDCTGLFAALVTSDCSYRDRVTRWWPNTNTGTACCDGGARHKPCGSCKRLRRWRMRSITRQKCVGCTGLFAALVTSDCSYRDRVTRWWPTTNTGTACCDGGARHKSCGSCRRLRRWRMRSITRQKCVGCTGLFAALVTSDYSYRDRVTRWWPNTNTGTACCDGGARHKPCGSCRRLRRWRMRSITRQKCVGCTGLFAAL